MKREWLIQSRKEKGITQEELAELCDSTQMMISNIENGIRRPSPELAQKIASVLGFDWTKFYENQKEGG